MSSSQPSQTLFRFVSLRNPQLPDNEGKENRFIFRSATVANGQGNVFDEALETGSGSKWERLAAVCPAFAANVEVHIGSEADIKDIAGEDFYAFAVWLARNRDSFTNAALIQRMNPVNQLSTGTLANLWNNLFYQVLTQESFYIKDAVLQCLLANHVKTNADNDETTEGYKLNSLLAGASVVLPKELFVEGNSPGSTLAFKTVPLPKLPVPLPKEMEMRMAVLEAKHFNTKYVSIQQEAARIEKLYRAAYKTSYETAWINYQQTIKTLWDQYNSDQETATLSWCANRNPNIQMEPNDPCNQPPTLALPVIPAFDFSFDEENIFLKQKLSEENIFLINQADEGIYYDKDENDDPSKSSTVINAPTFEKVHQNISAKIDKNSSVIAANTYNPAQKIASIGGIAIPVSNARPAYADNFKFLMCSKVVNDFTQRFIFSMDLYVPNSSYEFDYMQYRMVPTPQGYPQFLNQFDRVWSVPVDDGVVIHITGMFTDTNFPFLASQTSSVDKVSGSIYFTSGAEYSFEVEMSNSFYTKCIWGKALKETDGWNEEGSDTDNPPVQPSPVFRPSGFGVKQLGIADYRKVEQSVHCYVEGEVAHIENIMAREYREKSTRRLRRSENTTTTSSESEREQLSDTTSTDRFEMQNEISKVLQETKDYAGHANISIEGLVKFDAGASFASHNSKEESTRAAVTQAKDITERAMDRVVSRVKQERVEKIIEEYEENNKHGFDNTKGDKHVVGVYRWVDKIYKNQIYNYGKRLMFEFMVPEPGRLHTLGLQEIIKSSATVITKPIDPRHAIEGKIAKYTDLDQAKTQYWAGIYNVETDSHPAPTTSVCKSFSFTTPETSNKEWEESAANNADIELPEGYVSVYATTTWNHPHEGNVGLRATAGNINIGDNVGNNGVQLESAGFSGHYPVSYSSLGFHAGNINFRIDLALTGESIKKWQIKTYKTIIDAYEKALAEYNEAIAAQQVVAQNIKQDNPAFYRQIENTVLRKNCISYLIDQNPNALLTYGKAMYKNLGGSSFSNYEIDVSKSLDDYTSFAKFLEQAFEWNIMSYYFYPFYWGNRSNWQSLYQYDNADPLFRNFMQSGLARVVVTVRPGFENAVRFYMQTGLIWNGGEVPLIDDPLHLSIVDELRQPVGEKEGKAWVTRVPTSLTILQANSIGLVVDKALPCNCDDVTAETWDNHDKVPCGDNFKLTYNQMNAVAKAVVQFSFVKMENFSTIGDFDTPAYFPREYECMGQAITINRDAAWNAADSTIVIYEKLAEQLSLIPGVEAAQATSADGNVNGIRFTVDSSIAPVFTFKKPTKQEEGDVLKAYILDESLSFTSPIVYPARILDRDGTPLQPAQIGMLLPIARFKV